MLRTNFQYFKINRYLDICKRVYENIVIEIQREM